MTYIYFDHDNNVKMFSETPIETDLLEAETTDSIQVSSDYTVKFKDGKIVYEDTPEVKEKKNLKEKVKNAKTIDELKDIITSLL